MGREIKHDSIKKNRAHNLTRNKEEEKKASNPTLKERDGGTRMERRSEESRDGGTRMESRGEESREM